MSTNHRKHKKMHGAGFFDLLKKGANFVKDNGLLSKGLNVASNIAGALGNQGIADKLNTGATYAQKFGAGRKKGHKKRLVRYKTTSPTLQAEVMDMDGNNKLFGTGHKRKYKRKAMHGAGFFDDFLGGLGSVAKTVLPIIAQVAPMLAGRGLKLAGAGLSLSGGSHLMNPHLQNYGGENSYHMGKHMSSSRRNDMRGSGFLSRVTRNHSKMSLI